MDGGQIVHQGDVEQMRDSDKFNQLMAKSKHDDEEQKEKAEATKDKQEEIDTLEEAVHGITHHDESSQDDRSTNITTEQDFNDVKLEVGSVESEKNIQKLTLDEDREKGGLKLSLLKVLYHGLGGCKALIAIGVLKIVSELCFLSFSPWLAYWGNHAHEKDPFYFLYVFYFISGLCFVTFFVSLLLIFLQSLRCSKEVHQKMAKAVMEAPLNLFFDRVPSGRILNRFSDDIEKVDTRFGWCFSGFLASFFSVTGAFVACIILSSYLLIICIVSFLYLCRKYFKKFTNLNRELTRLKSIANSPIAGHFAETLQGLAVIRSFSQQSRFFSNQMAKQDDAIKNFVLMYGNNEWYSITCSIASQLVMIPVTVAILFFRNEIGLTVSTAGILTAYMISCCDNTTWFLWETANMESQLVSFERCHAFTKIEPEVIQPRVRTTRAVPTAWPERGQITISNYSTRYRPGLPHVLNSLNLTITPGQNVGIVGRTGSGKSTLMLTLLRLLEPDHGTITVDGVDLQHVSLPHLRNKLSVIPQDPHLFEGTLRENLDVLGVFTEKQIIDSLRMVNLYSLIDGKPEGLNMAVKSGGENLSAGEKQMVCIARALLKRSKIILIDEATSNIDLNNEEVFLRTIKEKFEKNTVLTIAHRLKTIVGCDKVVVMGEGRVEEIGSPKELIEREDSIFGQMWREAKKLSQAA